jgi:hypothetical protein
LAEKLKELVGAATAASKLNYAKVKHKSWTQQRDKAAILADQKFSLQVLSIVNE